MARDVLAFYAEHFPSLDRDGKMVITPAQGLETWLCVTLADCTTNPVPEVAGLRVVLPALLDLPAGVDARDREAWRRLLAKTPAVVLEHGVIAPAQRHPRQTQNQENVELYAVHPYRWVTATEPENKTLLRHALQSYDRRQFQCNRGWCQDVLVAALLGKAQAAMTQVVAAFETVLPSATLCPSTSFTHTHSLSLSVSLSLFLWPSVPLPQPLSNPLLCSIPLSLSLSLPPSLSLPLSLAGRAPRAHAPARRLAVPGVHAGIPRLAPQHGAPRGVEDRAAAHGHAVPPPHAPHLRPAGVALCPVGRGPAIAGPREHDGACPGARRARRGAPRMAPASSGGCGGGAVPMRATGRNERSVVPRVRFGRGGWMMVGVWDILHGNGAGFGLWVPRPPCRSCSLFCDPIAQLPTVGYSLHPSQGTL